MYRVCGLRMGPKFGVKSAAGKNIYLRLTVEKMRAFAAFTKKYLRPYGWSGSIFTAATNYTNLKTEIYH